MDLAFPRVCWTAMSFLTPAKRQAWPCTIDGRPVWGCEHSRTGLDDSPVQARVECERLETGEWRWEGTTDSVGRE